MKILKYLLFVLLIFQVVAYNVLNSEIKKDNSSTISLINNTNRQEYKSELTEVPDSIVGELSVGEHNIKESVTYNLREKGTNGLVRIFATINIIDKNNNKKEVLLAENFTTFVNEKEQGTIEVGLLLKNKEIKEKLKLTTEEDLKVYVDKEVYVGSDRYYRRVEYRNSFLNYLLIGSYITGFILFLTLSIFEYNIRKKDIKRNQLHLINPERLSRSSKDK